MKALLVGRHAPDFGNEEIEVIEQRPVTFPATAKECVSVLAGLREEANAAGAVLLLQNTPGQVAVAMSEFVRHYQTGTSWTRTGVVISTPGARPTESTFTFQGSAASLDDTVKAIRFANPRAKVAVDGVMITVAVVPPMRFEFDHIEWF